MASALSVDAQEFVPGTGILGLQPEELPSSLSVDAPVFVPVAVEKQDEKSSTIFVEKPDNKTSAVQRRGRFVHTDSRTRTNHKNMDNSDFANNSTATKKENNNRGSSKSQSTADDSKNINILYYSKECSDPKKVKQSFSLEYSIQQKQASSTELQKNVSKEAGFETNKNLQQLTCNSGESKPIVLWSSIVKQVSKTEKIEDVNIMQKANNKDDYCEKPSNTKKYSRNKWTRKKNVQPGQSNEKFNNNTNEWRREIIDEDILMEANKLPSTQFNSKFPSDIDNNEKHVLTDPTSSNNNLTQKSVSLTNNSRGKSKDKGGQYGAKNYLAEVSSNNVDYETIYEGKCVADDSIAARNDLRTDCKQNHRAWENKGKVKSKTMKRLNCFEEDVYEGNNVTNKVIKSNQISKKTESSEHLKRPTEYETENTISGNSVNLCDDAIFPALAEGSVHTSIPVLSYSAVAKRIPMNANPKPTEEKINPQSTVHEIQLSESERRSLKKRQKVLKRKMKTKDKKREANMNKPKPEIPEKCTAKEMTFDLSDMFTKLQLLKTPLQKSQKSVKKIKMSTGVISVVAGLAKKNTHDGRRMERNKYGTSHTIMDGTTPIRKRGKERETPKKKKPTLLKKVITAERERKRALLEKNILPTAIESTEEMPSCEENIDEEKQRMDIDVFGENHENRKEREINERSSNSDLLANTENNEEPFVEGQDGSDRVQYMNEFPEDIWKKMHSKKFREYCDHVLTKDINHSTYNLLVTLQKFQDRIYHENPAKYKQKRRFILGLREVLKHLKLKRLKAVIIAPNLERISSKGGLDDYLGSIITICNELGIPKIFAMNRHVLGRVIKKLAPVSVVGIFDYSGAQDIFKELMNNVQSAKDAYQEKVRDLCGNDCKRDDTIIYSEEKPTDTLVDSKMGNEQKGMNCENEQLKQQMLNQLQIHEYWTYDVEEGESDDWVTDTEGAP